MIRFLGYKGVVCVDEQLDNNPNGTKMRLRPSMRKFVQIADEAEIEIAQSFEHPNTCYLNRSVRCFTYQSMFLTFSFQSPLVMVLEGLGVRIDNFVELQEQAVAAARTIDDSGEQFREVLNENSLGRPYRLSQILQHFEDLGLVMHPREGNGPCYDTPFIKQIRQISMLGILREIKHNARIPIPESHLLVGVADEGVAYEGAGMKNVYTLKEAEIYGAFPVIDTWLIPI
jgi:RNA-dependent RNA polymerase